MSFTAQLIFNKNCKDVYNRGFKTEAVKSSTKSNQQLCHIDWYCIGRDCDKMECKKCPNTQWHHLEFFFDFPPQVCYFQDKILADHICTEYKSTNDILKLWFPFFITFSVNFKLLIFDGPEKNLEVYFPFMTFWFLLCLSSSFIRWTSWEDFEILKH